MTGTVELAPDGAFLLIRFPYREDLVAVVRDLPGRRWDPKGKQWRVPADQVELVYATLSRHMFEFAPEVSSALAGTLGITKAPAKPKAGKPADRPDTAGDGTAADALTISALNELVRDALRAKFPQTIWVIGEIVDFDKQGNRAHRFFTLVERDEGAARPRASVSVALFERTAEALLPKLQNAADPLTLQDGIEIRALVKVDFYPQNGRFQLIVEDIDPSFTLGKMALSKEQILRELREAGVVDKNRSLPLPIPPLRVGVLTSPDSDGWNDFLRHVQESGVGFDIALLPVKVQGAELKPLMLAGLRWFQDHAAEFDVLCILRGGGSRTDLAWFDDRELAFAVANHPLKVLVGIGHERDQSVLDVIAHGEKTPTAVAAFLVRSVETARQVVAEGAQRLCGAVADLVHDTRARLHDFARDLQASVFDRMARERAFLASASRSLASGSLRCLRDGERRCSTLARDLGGAVRLQLQRHGSNLDADRARLRHGALLLLERATSQLAQQTARQRLLDPTAVLRRGFALLRDEHGKVLASAHAIKPDQILIAQLRDGSVRSVTQQVNLDARQEPEEEE